MIRQVFRLNVNDVGCVCLMVNNYPSSVSAKGVLNDAFAQGLIIHPGIYVVTKCDLVTGTKEAFCEDVSVFTLHQDGTVEAGARGAVSVPSLASWPPRRR